MAQAPDRPMRRLSMSMRCRARRLRDGAYGPHRISSLEDARTHWNGRAFILKAWNGQNRFFELECLMNSKFGPDSIDWKILELLQRNARLSNSEIGRSVGLSQPAVTGRIQRLEDGGIIDGYAARLNPKRMGR